MTCEATFETERGTIRCDRQRMRHPHFYHEWSREMEGGAVMTIKWDDTQRPWGKLLGVQG